MEISENGINFIKQYEGFRSDPYLDSAGIPTIGYGTICYLDGTRVTMDDPPINEMQAQGYLQNNINGKCAVLNNIITVDLNQNQYDALCSLAYNIGINAFKNSTLLKDLNNSDYQGAYAQFLVWDKAGGQVNQGLLNRRKAEQALFIS